MKRWMSLWAIAAWGLAAGSGCGSNSEPERPAEAAPAPAPASPNAADVYASVQDGLVKPANAVLDNPGALHPMLAQHSADIERVIEATKLPRCDFGVRYEDGLNAMMPHLGQLRGLARVLRADATRLSAAGDAQGAARRIAAMLRLAAHITAGGRSQIELLVGCAVAQMGCDLAASTPGLGQAAAKAEVQQALVSVQAGGVLNSSAIVREDGRLTAGALRSGQVPAGIKVMGKEVASCTPAEREAAAKKLEAFSAEVVAAWDAPGAAATLAGIVKRAEAEGLGDILGSPGKARESVDRLKAAIPGAYAALSK
jgi:hypothetical protein